MIKAIIVVLYLFLATSALAQNPAPVKLAWTHSTDNVAVTGYNIYRDGKKIGSSPTTAYTDATVAPTTQYSYTVSAFDAAGNESDTSMPYVIKTGTIIILPPGNDHVFTMPSGSVLHYMSPGGSDGANGLTPGTAWATPNHAMKCGEVIIAATGTYAGGLSRNFGAVSNCPSTTGGIDGQGGVWFAVVLCAGSLTTCKATGSPAIGWDLNNTNWAVEGFSVENNTGARAFETRTAIGPGGGACSSTGTQHHIAAINNVVFNSDQAFGSNDGGCNPGGSNPPTWDYLAVVGMISQNGAQDNICLGAIDLVGTGRSDLLTTQIKGIVYGNFSYHNRNTNCDSQFDTEGFMMDSPQIHSTNGIWNFFNNMAWDNARQGFQLQSSCTTNVAFSLNIFNNTMYANWAGADTAGHPGNGGEITIQSNGCPGVNPLPVTIGIKKNIALSKYSTSPTTGGTTIYAMFIDTADGSQTSSFSLLTNGSTGSENIYKGIHGSCSGPFNGGGCDAGFNIQWADPTNLQGTNFLGEDPLFANVTDLLANWVGAPNCAGFTNVTACMGWNTSMGSMTTQTPIANLRANSAHSAGKGYQLPSTTCVSSGDIFNMYPTWLKGIVYLQWDSGSSTITEKADMVTKPCGL